MSNRYATDNNKAIGTEKVSIFGFRHSYEATDQELEALADEVIEWSKQDHVIKAGMFLIEKNVAWETWGEWCDKSSILRKAYDNAKFIIGERRERKGLDGTYNAGLVAQTMPLYDREYRALRQELMASKHDSGSQQTIVVVRDKFPETDIVSPRSVEGTE